MVISNYFKKLKKKYHIRKLNKQFDCNFHFQSNLENAIVEGRISSLGYCNLSDSIIGIGTYFGTNVTLPNSFIGRFCSISKNVSVVYFSHPLNFVSTYPSFYDNTKFIRTDDIFVVKKEFDLKTSDGYFCKIGNDVWIGENVLIRGGFLLAMEQ